MRLRVLAVLGITWAAYGCAKSEPARPMQGPANGGPVVVHLEGEAIGATRQAVEAWIDTATRALSEYFGHFPVKHVDLTIHLEGKPGAHDGVTYGGRRINIFVGPDTRAAQLQRDWILVHEMFHLAFPEVDDGQHAWMGEGLSTYLEPIARARIGNMPVEQYWRETVEGAPQGLPQAGDQGLNHTHTWGRTYWGGATFWLIADVRIREATGRKRSLDDAIRGILAAGGDGSAHWPAARVIEVGDRVTGTHVLHELYEEMAERSTSPDLAALWGRLGVRVNRGRSALMTGRRWRT